MIKSKINLISNQSSNLSSDFELIERDIVTRIKRSKKKDYKQKDYRQKDYKHKYYKQEDYKQENDYESNQSIQNYTNDHFNLESHKCFERSTQ